MQRPIKISSSAAFCFSSAGEYLYWESSACACLSARGSHTYAFGLGKCTWPSIKPSLYRTAIICALIESNWVAEHARSQQNGIHTAHTSVSAPHDLPIASSSPPPRQLWVSDASAEKHTALGNTWAPPQNMHRKVYSNIPTQLFDKANGFLTWVVCLKISILVVFPEVKMLKDS
jgi:hypothetical protein